MTRLILALAACGALAGCANSYIVPDPVTGEPWMKCHTGIFEPSACTVKAEKDKEVVVSGAGAIQTFNTSAGVATEGVAIGTLLAK